MSEDDSTLKVLLVGGTGIAALLAWRLKECEYNVRTTLVWPNASENGQDTFTFHSKEFGTHKHNPDLTVRSLSSIPANEKVFDYVFVCLRYNPDVYDLSDMLKPVVTPDRTCVIFNAFGSLGVGQFLQQSFPENEVLVTLPKTTIVQRGANEFWHGDHCHLLLGAAEETEHESEGMNDFAELLRSGGAEVDVYKSLAEQEFNEMLAPLTMFPLSVLCHNPRLSFIDSKPEMKALNHCMKEELVQIANVLNFGVDEANYQKQQKSIIMSPHPNPTYMEFSTGKPIEILHYLHYCLDVAHGADIDLPHLETVTVLLGNVTRAPANEHGYGLPRSNPSVVSLQAMPRRHPSSGAPYARHNPNNFASPSATDLTADRGAIDPRDFDMLSLTSQRSRRNVSPQQKNQMHLSLNARTGLEASFIPYQSSAYAQSRPRLAAANSDPAGAPAARPHVNHRQSSFSSTNGKPLRGNPFHTMFV
ncbi:oxidoreductase [Schizosaccharomyces japonicus yFS275]|uniref:Oxidoreductase n=1 Tax=Schizosaccharomyces japonicus (strain yFS275 / FY16936) TaxID=402676 RepID=B6K785_SCHJY|nr:oxidoreductase [Schizosaccharomyces japonicus yFS275]EEB09389.2 oxidoreductase [Schizosaccharomyces japonicus yFS275]